MIIERLPTYYYVTNLQGDIIAILNGSGAKVVEYTYDAWGNILSTTGTLASTLGVLNPLRYRGYVYNAETGLYYLQSRYYNPDWGRFINPDAFPSTGQGLLGNNMFAYCGNNPVGRIDPYGTKWLDDFLIHVQNRLKEEKDRKKKETGTLAVGYCGSGALGFAGAGGFGVAADKQGNIGLILFVNGGGGMPSLGVNGFITVTNAPNIKKLLEWGQKLVGRYVLDRLI